MRVLTVVGFAGSDYKYNNSKSFFKAFLYKIVFYVYFLFACVVSLVYSCGNLGSNFVFLMILS